ncbi:MAG: alpha/beta hydrolase [Rubripirellula sp.]
MFKIFLTVVVVTSPFVHINAIADDAATLASGVQVTRDVVYGTGAGVELHLDIAKPTESTRPAPCIVVIHGGAWRQGNKSSHLNEIKSFAQLGYVAATLEYRFCPEHPFPAQVEDVKCAVRYLRANAEKYGIDPTRFGAIGFSAGAHLSMMLGTVDVNDAADKSSLEGDGGWPDQSSKVQAVVAYFGPTVFRDEGLTVVTKKLVVDFLGGTQADVPDAYRLASPLSHVSSGDAPMLLFQGTEDPLVPYNQAFEMAEAMTKADVPGRVELLIDAGHGWGGKLRDRTNRESVEFFGEHLSHEK